MEYLGQNFSLSTEEKLKVSKINDLFEAMMYLTTDNNKVILSRLSERIRANFEELETSLEKKNDEYKKWVFYVGHYQTLWSFLARTGMVDDKCLLENYQGQAKVPCEEKPTFNSHIILTIYQDDSLGNDIYIRTVYNGKDITSNLQKCYKDGRCLLNNFRDSYLSEKDIMSEDDIDRKCGNYDVNLAAKLWALIGASILFAVIMIIVFITTLRKKLKNN